jgi:hypothetical protein
MVYEPPVPKTAKGYYLSSPFQKRGEKVPLFLDVGTGKAIPLSKLQVREKYVSYNYCISEIHRAYCTLNTAFAI